VHEDNLLFLRERQLLANPFFDTMKTLLEQALDNNPDLFSEESPHSQSLFDFMQRMVFELMPFTSETASLKDLHKLLLRALALNTSQLINFIDSRILVDRSKLEKDERSFIENMV
jgi:hypothetical protein